MHYEFISIILYVICFRCCNTVDCNGRTLLFVVKGGSDSTILWRQTVQIACVRVCIF